jgi:diguanylate cyclase (GGDEF)-like protein
VCWTFAAVAALTAIATAGLPHLPSLIDGVSYDRLNSLGIGPFVLACNITALALVVARLRFRTIMGLWLAVAMLAACVDVSMTITALARFSLGWYLGRFASLFTGLCVLAALLTELLHLYGRVGETNRYLARLATTDGLTGVPNRRSFDETLAAEWRRMARDDDTLSLLMLDIDRFKRFNDRYGHLAGDGCLRAVATSIAASLQRPADVTARYGGEEFALILPATDESGAAIIAERVRDAVEALAIPHEHSELGQVTISVGAATVRPREGGEPQDLIDASDQALYRAKESGRNRVISQTQERPRTFSLHPAIVD